MHERWSLIITSPLQTLHRVQHELDPFSMPRKTPALRSSDAKNMMYPVTAAGPYSHKAGYAAIGEAMGGLRYVVGDPSNPPSRTGISLGDTLAGTFGCIGGLMALHARERIGRGQVVDSAIYEAVLAVYAVTYPDSPPGNPPARVDSDCRSPCRSDRVCCAATS